MKKFTHAWLSLKAIELLVNKRGQFTGYTGQYLDNFLNFIQEFPSTFVRGAWFPDTIIRDNIRGGHTWKYKFDDNGRENKRRPGDYNSCIQFVQAELKRKTTLVTRYSDLPDRCEGLSLSIRDMIKITNELQKGDIISFNDSQIAAFFLMLSHYVADAHMPLHADIRDFNKPSHVHADMEKIWEDEIIRCYDPSIITEQYDLNQNYNLVIKNQVNYDNSFLKQVDTHLNAITFTPKGNMWYKFLGNKNSKVWDYLVGVCHVSFLMSHLIFPEGEYNYDIVRIKNDPVLNSRLIQYTPNILADAVTSIAIVWLSTWMRWELL